MLGPVAFLIPVGVALSAIGTTISNSFVAARFYQIKTKKTLELMCEFGLVSECFLPRLAKAIF